MLRIIKLQAGIHLNLVVNARRTVSVRYLTFVNARSLNILYRIGLGGRTINICDLLLIIFITHNRLPLIGKRQLRIRTRIGLQRDTLTRLDHRLRRNLHLQPFVHLDKKCHFLGGNAIGYFTAIGSAFCHLWYIQYRLRTDAVSIRDPFLTTLDTFSPLVSHLFGNGRVHRDFHLQLITKCYQHVTLPVTPLDLKRTHGALQRITGLSGIIPVRNDAKVLSVRI